MIMKYYYWIALVVLVFLLCYTVANRDTIIMENLTNATSGPMNTGKGPAAAGTPAAPAMSEEDKGKCLVSLIDGMFSLGAITLPAKCSSMKSDFDTKIKEQVDSLSDNERNACTSQFLEPTVKEFAAKYTSGIDVSNDVAKCLKVLYVKKLSSGSGGGGGGGGGSGGGGDGDVAALTSKLTALQKEVSDIKAQAKDQSSQAAAAQASLQAIT